MPRPAVTREDGSGSDAKVLSFRVGALELAIPAGEVAEVVRPPYVTRVPHAPACLAGVVNLRGAVVPVLSLARLLDQAEAAAGRVIMLDRNPPLGLAVDAVTALAAAGPTTEAATGGRLFLDEDGGRRLIDLDGLLAREFGGQRRKPATAAIEAGTSAARGGAPIREIGLLGFDLAGQTYALPLERVREVMALPSGLTALPRLDDALVGVVPHRGGLLPLASLPVLLGLAPPTGALFGRVIVAQIGDSLVGLVVDRLNAVMRAPEEAIGPVPAVLNRGAGEAQIDAIFRAEGGNRLVSILSPERLFREETTGDILAEGRAREMEAVSETIVAGRERFVIFRLGEETYGLPIAAVDEVARLPDPLTRLPRAPAFVEGVMNFRGKVIPLIDLRRRFEVGDAAPSARRRVLITRIGDLQAGFIVDAVSQIAYFTQDQLSAAPDLPGQEPASAEPAKLFDRVAQVAVEGRMVLLVDPTALVDRVEADLLKAMSAASATP